MHTQAKTLTPLEEKSQHKVGFSCWFTVDFTKFNLHIISRLFCIMFQLEEESDGDREASTQPTASLIFSSASGGRVNRALDLETLSGAEDAS